MVNGYVLLTDSCCDLPAEIIQKHGITVVSLSVNTRMSKSHINERNIDVSGFYKDLRVGKIAFTSAVQKEDFEKIMHQYLNSGKDILYIGFSSTLSLTYSNACITAEKLIRQFPNRKIVCIDSKSASMGEGLLVYNAALKMSEGMSLEDISQYISELVPHLCHWFTVDNINLLKHGGRIHANVAAGSTVLHMKPLLHMDEEGYLINVEKIRGRKAVIKALFDKLKQTAVDIEKQTVMISHGDCKEDADWLAEMIRNECGPADIIINTVNPVIGAHSGPGTLALFFIGTNR